jgi:hypothetical protein
MTAAPLRLLPCLAVLSALLVAPLARAEDAPRRQTALTARMTLKVAHPDKARAAILADAREARGFPALVSSNLVRLKLPPDSLGTLLPKIAAQGFVLDKAMDRVDLTQIIAQLEAQLRSKTEILERLRGFLADSNVKATLAIEQQMTTLVSELERVKGELRVQQERAQWAVVDVAFNFEKRDRIIYVESPFGWLNTIDLRSFLWNF